MNDETPPQLPAKSVQHWIEATQDAYAARTEPERVFPEYVGALHDWLTFDAIDSHNSEIFAFWLMGWPLCKTARQVNKLIASGR